MASSGIRRKVDDLGRVVIPAPIRRSLNIREGDAVEVTLEGERIVLARPRDACVFCGREDDDLQRFRNRLVCRDCVGALGLLATPPAPVPTATGPAPAPAAAGPAPAPPMTAPAPTPATPAPAAPLSSPAPAPSAPAPAAPAPSAPLLPPQVVARAGVVDGDEWARLRRQGPPATDPATDSAAGPETDADADAGQRVREGYDPASTTAW